MFYFFLVICLIVHLTELFQHFISTILLAGVVLAAPEAPINGAAPYPAAADSGPYPPSGWKPSGRLLVLPAKQIAAQQQVYGIPNEYGPPSPSTEAEPTTTDFPSTTPQVRILG